MQQVWCVDNHVNIAYFYVTFAINKCDEILLKKTENQIPQELKNVEKRKL